MKTDFLKGLGLSREVIDKIMAENGKDIAAEQKKTSKAEQDRDSYKEQADNLQTRLDDAGKQIEKFKKMDIESIQRTADDWKQKAEDATAEADKNIQAMQFDYALSDALAGAKAKNTKAVKALLDMDGLKYNDEKIVGLDEQIEKLKADNDYLFESDKPAPKIVKGTGGGDPLPGGEVTKEAFNKMGYRDRVALKKDNPDLYAELSE